MGFFDRQSQPAGGMSQEQMQRAFFRDVSGLKADQTEYIKRSGMTIPANLRGNPQAMAMHLIQSGQVPPDRMRMVQPLIDRMMGRK